MCILINRISQNVALHGRPHLLTFALLSRGGIPPWTTFLDLHDQPSFLHSLMRISMIAFTCPQTTRCPWIGPPVQYIYIYIYTTGPIIPTISLWNSPFLLLGKEGGFWYHYNYHTLITHHLCPRKYLFNCPTHTPDASTSKTHLHLISMAPCSPRSTMRCGSNGWGFYWNWGGNFPICLSL